MLYGNLVTSAQGFRFDANSDDVYPSIKGTLLQSYDCNALYATLDNNKYKNISYNPQNKVEPLCAAIKVSSDVQPMIPYTLHKVSQSCDTCPFNRFGSSLDPARPGKKGCHTTKRVSVLKGGIVLSFKFPLTSLKGFRQFMLQTAYADKPLHSIEIEWSIRPHPTNQYQIIGKVVGPNESSSLDEYRRLQKESDDYFLSLSDNKLLSDTAQINSPVNPPVQINPPVQTENDFLDEDFVF